MKVSLLKGQLDLILGIPLCKKCPYSDLFWSVFPAFGLNTDQNNFEYGHFSHTVQNVIQVRPYHLDNLNLKRQTIEIEGQKQ